MYDAPDTVNAADYAPSYRAEAVSDAEIVRAARRSAARRALAWGALGAAAVLLVSWVGYLAYVDHQRTTALWIYVNQLEAQRQQLQQAQPPAPRPPALPVK